MIGTVSEGDEEVPTVGTDRHGGLATAEKTPCDDDRKKLQALLVRCRRRVEAGSPAVAVGARGPRLQGLSQEAAAALLGVSARWYGEFERGRIKNHAPGFLERVPAVLHMTTHEREMMFLLTTGQQPPRPDGNLPLDPTWQAALNASSLPGYVSNSTWDIEMWNPAFEAIWDEGDLPTNTVRFLLLNQRAREKYLPNWRDGWALQILRQLRAAQVHFSWERGLDELHDEVQAAVQTDSELRAVWEKAGESEYVHPIGDTRILRHREWGETEITLLMTRPLDAASGHRIVWIVPNDPALLQP